MIISTKGRYGLRAMFTLAQRSDGQPVSLKTIADEQNISITYLEQLFSKLRAAGLVTSIRGAMGGYILAKPADEISVGSVLSALEGPLTPADCVVGNCDKAADCFTHDVWCKIYDGINGVLESMTLGNMLNDCRTKESLCGNDTERCK